jgi:hypothetical protein
MDIRLQPSACLLMLRIFFWGVAMLATLTSNLDWFYQLLLCAVMLLKLKPGITDPDPACCLQLSTREVEEAQTGSKKLVLQFCSGRRIEFTLTAYYCLWWVQILYLASAHRTAIVIVLPDSCSDEERWQLRQHLGQ